MYEGYLCRMRLMTAPVLSHAATAVLQAVANVISTAST